MKSIIAIAVFLLPIVSLAAEANANAANVGSSSQAKTRAEVRRELIQAYEDGVLPFRRSEYPPNADSKKKNREAYARAHPENASKRNTRNESTGR